jgi:hypothetical protein
MIKVKHNDQKRPNNYETRHATLKISLYIIKISIMCPLTATSLNEILLYQSIEIIRF